MGKRAIVILLTGAICLSVVGCSSEMGMPSSHVESSQASSMITSTSSEVSTNKQFYLDLLNHPMKELGETEVINILSIEEPSEDDEISTITVHFSAGERLLQGIFSIQGTEVSLFSISKEEDSLHCYYCPGAEEANSFGFTLIRLYDYNTDEEVDISSSAEAEIDTGAVTRILSKYEYLNKDEESSTDSVLALNVNIDSSDLSSKEEYADTFYNAALTFIADYYELDSLPYGTVGFQIILDGEKIGFMMFEAAPEYGLVGTVKPVLFNQDLADVFKKQYDIRMLDIDMDNLKE